MQLRILTKDGQHLAQHRSNRIYCINLTNINTNLNAARGRILDADYAAETTKLAKQQIKTCQAEAPFPLKPADPEVEAKIMSHFSGQRGKRSF